MLDLFRLVGGIDIQNEGLTSNAYIIQGTGVPGGDTSVQDSAPIGSAYLRTDSASNNLQLYYKIGVNNTAADWTMVADKAYVDSAVSGISWREPVVVRDGTSTTLPTGTAGDPIVVDGISVSNGQRVLFNTLTANPNVYIYNQATGIFAQDANLATNGDALFVVGGTSTGNRWTFNGTSWVLFGAETDVSEITFIDTFIGKTVLGSNNPSYSSNFVVGNGQSLQTAIGKLDAVFGNGAITNIGSSFSLNGSLDFDAQLESGVLTITGALNALNDAIGNRTYTQTDLFYPLQTNGGTVTADIEKLNVAVHDIIVGGLAIKGTVATTPEAYTTIDSVPVALASEINWMVQVRETGSPANRRSSQIHAITDGTNVDFTRFAELNLGAGIVGFGVQVVIVGTNVVLQAKATNGYDYVVKRVSMSSF